jgi:hypothetical protein
MSEQLGKDCRQPKWYEMSRAIELYINADKKLNANVDFYSASTYATLGIDIDLYTPIFAISRISGWAAHVIEQLDDNRLIRPRAEYIGPAYPSPWIFSLRGALLQLLRPGSAGLRQVPRSPLHRAVADIPGIRDRSASAPGPVHSDHHSLGPEISSRLDQLFLSGATGAFRTTDAPVPSRAFHNR